MDKYAETKEVLSHMAAVKMGMNSHKGEIEDLPEGKIFELLEQEIRELEDAVVENRIMAVIEEGADVMNYVVGLVHQRIHKYRTRK